MSGPAGPAVLTFDDPRLLAGMAAFLAAGLLLLLYFYRRRNYILLWSVGWVMTGLSMGLSTLVANDDTAGYVSYGISQFLGLAGALTFILSAEAYRAAVRVRQAYWLVAVPALLWFSLSPLAMRAAGAFAPGHVAIGLALVTAGIAHGALLRKFWLPGAAVSGLILGLIGFGHLQIALNATGPLEEAATRFISLMSPGFLLTALGMQVMIFEDMTSELRQANEQVEAAQAELRELAVTDPLTRCRNRRFFDEIIGFELERHRRYNIPLSLLFTDINRFKAINDELGHETGDRVLQEVAAFLMRNVREADYVFRWGGDEFLILMSCSYPEARRRAAALQAAFAAAPGITALPPGVGLSVGCVEVPPGTEAIMDYVAIADELMYADKRGRR